MKRPRLSLPFKVNSLMVAIILVISALLLAISNFYYWTTVYDPHVQKLNQPLFQSQDLMPAASGILHVLGSEKTDAILQAEETGDELAVFARMSEVPSLAENGEGGEGRTLLTDVLDINIAILHEWDRLELNAIYVEARKNGTIYHVMQNTVADWKATLFVTSFGKEETRFPGLEPEQAETPTLFRDESGAWLVRCVPFHVQEGDLLLWAAYDMDEFFLNHRHFLRQCILLILLMTVLASVAGTFLMRRLVTRRILKLAKAAGDFRPGEDGKYAEESFSRAEIDTPDEIGRLGRDIRTMQERIARNAESLAQMTAEKERISTELDLARQIQSSALPVNFPDRPEFDLYASMTPAREVGGDFYDFFLVDADHLAMVIADVSGKGIPAALFMMVAKSLIKNQLLSGCDPAQAMERVNRQLCEGNESKMFVTAWVAVLELSSGRGYACNAGHEKPALRRAGGKYMLLDFRHDLLAGVVPKAKYHSEAFTLLSGDSLFVYTDGVTEARDRNEAEFGEKELAKALNADAGRNPREIIGSIHTALDRFAGGAPQYDDITMMCLRYHGPEGRN